MAKKPTIFYNGKTWSYRYKILDENLITRYRVKGGYQTEKEAEEAYYVHQQKIKSEESHLVPNNENTESFAKYFEDWFLHKESLQGTTRLVYTYVMDLILPELQNVRLGAINSEYLKAKISWITKRAPSYGEKLYELFSMTFKDAYHAGKIAYNPLKNVRKPVRKKSTLKILTDEERRTLFQAILHSNWCLELLLALLCGLRKGEIIGLKFSDFNFEEKKVCIQRQVIQEISGENRNMAIVKPLNTSGGKRAISVPSIVLDEAKRRKAKVEYEKRICKSGYEDQGYLCCQKNGRCRSRSSLNTELDKLCDRNGLPHLSVDNLRDIYAAMMLQTQNVSFVTLKGLMGYSSIEEVYERYCGLAELNTDVADMIDKVF